MIKLFAIFILIGNSVFGQFTIRASYDFTSDSICVSPNNAFNHRINIPRIDKSNYTLEIRLYTLHELSNTKSLRRIYVINDTWKADEFDEWNNPVTIKKYKLSPTLSFDSLLFKLLSYNLFSLPNEISLKSRMKKFSGIYEGDSTFRIIRVNDGESYSIEIKLEDRFRVYEFSNPEIYSKHYEDVNEFKNFVNIINTFDSCLKRNSR